MCEARSSIKYSYYSILIALSLLAYSAFSGYKLWKNYHSTITLKDEEIYFMWLHCLIPFGLGLISIYAAWTFIKTIYPYDELNPFDLTSQSMKYE